MGLAIAFELGGKYAGAIPFSSLFIGMGLAIEEQI